MEGFENTVSVECRAEEISDPLIDLAGAFERVYFRKVDRGIKIDKRTSREILFSALHIIPGRNV